MTASVTTLGVGSGLQLQDILEQLREVDQKVIDRKQDDIETLDVQLEEFTTVKNKLLTLKSAALDLSLEGTFIGRTVSTSDEKVMTATVLDGATVKNTTIDVTKLAEQSSWLGDGFASSSSSSVTFADSVFSYKVGGGDVVSVDVVAGSSLETLADLINNDSDNPGVTASVINTGTADKPYKLLVQANETGDAHLIDLLAVPDLMAMNRQQDASATLDATFTVDGIAYQRASNSFDDILSGVTLDIKGAGKVSIAVASDDNILQEKVVSLVEAYNDVAQEVKSQSGYDTATEVFGVLAQTTLRDLPYDLQTLMTSFSHGDRTEEVQSLFDLGMSFERDGTISIDKEILASVITSSPDKFKLFFLGDSDSDIEGFADTVNNRLRTLTSPVGIVEGEKTAAQVKIDGLELKIEEETARLDKKYEQLTRQFIELDSFMNEMTSMSSFLTGQFDSLSNGWTGTGSN